MNANAKQQTHLIIKSATDSIAVYIPGGQKERIKAMHALARANVVAGYNSVDGFQSNANRNFWGSK